MLIYYAHPMSWYNTSQELQDVEALQLYGEVVNPNSKHFQDLVSKAQRRGWPVMQVFADYIRETADVVAFRPFKDGSIGAGVAREVFEAKIWGKEIWKLDTIHGAVVVDKIPSWSPNGWEAEPADIDFSNVMTVAATQERVRGKKL